MSHVVLLGDSIFDNAAYTGGEPDVVTHLRDLLPASWRATLCAVDGSVVASLASQLARVPADGTHLVVSIGGNDALANGDLLDTPSRSTADALRLFGTRVDAFERGYRTALEAVAARGLPVAACTIYNGNFEPRHAALVKVGLAIFNDAIFRVACSIGMMVVELRLVCTEPDDYANPIEPSGRGGRKIAAAVARAIGARDVASGLGERRGAREAPRIVF